MSCTRDVLANCDRPPSLAALNNNFSPLARARCRPELHFTYTHVVVVQRSFAEGSTLEVDTTLGSLLPTKKVGNTLDIKKSCPG